MKTASAYKALWDGDKQFLSAIAKEVATLVAVPENMDYFRKQITEFADKWQAYKTAYEADRKGEWQPSMGRPKNPLGTIWPLVYGSGWKDGAEKLLPGGPGINLFPYYPCRNIKAVLGACAILAVIQDNILPQCPPIAKDVLPKKLSQEIWRNLITGVDIEGTIGPGPRSVIRRHKIAGFLIDIRADIGQDATALSEIEKIFFNKYSQAYKKLLDRTNKNDAGGKLESVKAAWMNADLASTKQTILQLIEQGEGHTIEFKETLEYSVREDKRDTNLNKECLKTIAAFLNTDGGTLLIGVKDNGDITGIERDLQYVQRKNEDGFQLKLRNLVKNNLEPLPLGKVNICFEELTKATVCRVDVDHVSKNQLTHLGKDVYIRDGNTTRKLEGRDLTDWIQQREK